MHLLRDAAAERSRDPGYDTRVEGGAWEGEDGTGCVESSAGGGFEEAGSVHNAQGRTRGDVYEPRRGEGEGASG